MSHSPEADKLVRLAREGHSDGLLLLQIRLHDARLSSLRAEGLPFVAMGRCDDQPDLAWVDTDLEGAADLAVRHLLEGGHRRLAFLGAQPIFGYQYHALKGFKRAHDLAGLPFARNFCCRMTPRPAYRRPCSRSCIGMMAQLR